MTHYSEQKFNIPELKGISRKTIEEHLKLYSGYVKNTNLIYDKLEEYMKDSEKHAYALGELQRRFSFEWNGMRNHEYYFRSLEGGASALGGGALKDGALKAAIAAEFGSFENWLTTFKAIGLTRGIGWAMLYYDRGQGGVENGGVDGGASGGAGKLVHAWVDEQHLGQLNGAELVLGLDMWEHSYLFDYVPGEKKKYIEAFFENLNWSVIEENFAAAQG